MSARHGLSKTAWLTVLSLLPVCSGCDEPLKRASLIEETRVLGARVEVIGDPQRGSPAPGEEARLRLFVAAPDGAPNVAYAFSLCGVNPTNSGFPTCAISPFARALRTDPSTEAVAFDFTVPADLERASAPHGFASGVICPDDQALFEPDGRARCATSAGAAFGFEFDFAGPGEDNQNPTFATDALTLDGESWTASDLAAACADTPAVHAGTRHTLGVRLEPSDFDALIPLTAADPTRESLLVARFTTAGKLAHTLASLSPSRAAVSSEVDWDAPSPAATGGTRVQFYFVVRDGRGGEDLATRALCVVP
jgi:hypothetical protein